MGPLIINERWAGPEIGEGGGGPQNLWGGPTALWDLWGLWGSMGQPHSSMGSMRSMGIYGAALQLYGIYGAAL